MPVLLALVAIGLGYLLGSIPFGIIVGRQYGVDVRKTGSGKTGATNMLRSAGLVPALLVALGDVLKGAIPVLLARYVIASPHALGAQHVTWSAWITGLTGLAAVAGHNYPIYVGFKGGRGVATTAGIALALAFPATVIAMPFFFLPIILTRYVSLGSMIGACSLPLAEFILYKAGVVSPLDGPALTVTLAIAAIAIVVSHRDNIERLRTGTERKLGEKAKPSPAR